MALARALAVEPSVLLLDEPFGALDAQVRKELRQWLRRLHDEVHVTTVFVTHDQEEALEVADDIVVINGGRVEQAGTPDEIYDAPASEFVMRFLGPTTHFEGSVVRPHDLDVFSIAVRDAVKAEVTEVQRVGHEVRLSAQPAGASGITTVSLTRAHFRDLEVGEGDTVWLRLAPGASHIATPTAVTQPAR
jgi:sulfate transport system ATP-binding protein